jgi:hypothetical protein
MRKMKGLFCIMAVQGRGEFFFLGQGLPRKPRLVPSFCLSLDSMCHHTILRRTCFLVEEKAFMNLHFILEYTNFLTLCLYRKFEEASKREAS